MLKLTHEELLELDLNTLEEYSKQIRGTMGDLENQRSMAVGHIMFLQDRLEKMHFALTGKEFEWKTNTQS